MTYRDIKYDLAYSLYAQGASLNDVAVHLGVTRQSVYKAFTQRGFPLRSPNLQPTQSYDNKNFSLRPSGYYSLTVSPRTLMHRYVWEKERGKIPQGYDIHHKDEDKGNNHISNLECLPKSEHTRLYSPHNNGFGIGRKRILMLDKNGQIVREFECTSVAAKVLKIDRAGINMAINGKLKTYKNHKWKYANS